MLRANEDYLLSGMVDISKQLPEEIQGQLLASWVGTSYRELFSFIEERVPAT